jgi:hypothetical protein
MDRSTLAHNLRPLEHNGLITIETGGIDARRRQIRLTRKGRGLRCDKGSGACPHPHVFAGVGRPQRPRQLP